MFNFGRRVKGHNQVAICTESAIEITCQGESLSYFITDRFVDLTKLLGDWATIAHEQLLTYRKAITYFHMFDYIPEKIDMW